MTKSNRELRTPVIICRGAGITDDCFTLDSRILGYEVTWNVTKALRDAHRGLFGPSYRVRHIDLPQPREEDDANIDWKKVAAILNDNPDAMNQPALAIEDPNGDILTFIDGNHRIAACVSKGRDFQCYIIPHFLEEEYRVTFSQTVEGIVRRNTESQVLSGREPFVGNSPPTQVTDND
jgi:hypothetical protein